MTRPRQSPTRKPRRIVRWGLYGCIPQAMSMNTFSKRENAESYCVRRNKDYPDAPLLMVVRIEFPAPRKAKA